MEIAKGIFFHQGRDGEKIRPGASTCNVVVVAGNDALAMIDCGVVVGGSYRELHAQIQADGLSLDNLAWILLTHSHVDHINAAGAILAGHRAKVAAGEDDVPYCEDARRNFDGFIRDLGAELTREVYPYPMAVVKFCMWLAWGKQPKLSIDRALTGVESIDVGREIQAIALPGHTPGHIGYFVPDTGVLVLGDHIDFENAQGVDLNNPRSDFGAGMNSLSTIIDLEPEIIVPGHGEIIVGRAKVQQALAEVLAFDRELPESLSRLLSQGGATLKELTHRTFDDVTLSIESMTMMLVLHVLLHMEKEGHVQRSGKPGRFYWEAA